MPRPKKKTISKTAAVQEFLASGMKNAEIVEAVKTKYKLTVSPNYVSIIKHKSKQPSARSASNGHATRSVKVANHLSAAVDFIRAVGGIESAKQALRTVEEIKQLA